MSQSTVSDRPMAWPEKSAEESKRLLVLNAEDRLRAWTAAVNELYHLRGFDDPLIAARYCKAKERRLLAHEPQLSRNLPRA